MLCYGARFAANEIRAGVDLVNTSFGRVNQPATEEEDAVFERKVYIDGIAYLLKGLPQRMDASEVAQIRSALLSAIITIGEPQPAPSGHGTANLPSRGSLC